MKGERIFYNEAHSNPEVLGMVNDKTKEALSCFADQPITPQLKHAMFIAIKNVLFYIFSTGYWFELTWVKWDEELGDYVPVRIEGPDQIVVDARPGYYDDRTVDFSFYERLPEKCA